MLIYKLTSPSGKVYIGQTRRNIEIRIEEHKRSNTTLGYAFQKYPDINLWNIEIIEYCTSVKDLNDREIYWIEFYDSYYNGYNMTKGGLGWQKDFLSEEHKENLSKARKKFYKTERGQEWLEELSYKMKGNKSNTGNSAWNRGISPTEKTKRKMSAGQKKSYRDPKRREKARENCLKNWELGVYDNRSKPTEEQIRKRAEAQRGFKQTDYQKQRARETMLGKPKSEEQKRKQRELAKARENCLCPHCGIKTNPGLFKRWHGDNCKHKTI